MVFALLRKLGLYVLSSNVTPISKSTFHNAVKQEQFFFGRPIFCKKREVQIVINKVAVIGFVLIVSVYLLVI